MANFSPPPGTSDIFPDEVSQWYKIEDAAREIFPLYGYGELRTPIFEYTEVFERGIGGETEVVQKEMYTFKDRGGRSLTLRPEGTAGVMRALAATDVFNGVEKRVFYIGPMFRGERPAAGRKRQFHQVGVENVGKVAPELDAECIVMMLHYLESLDIRGSKLLLNTRSIREDRKAPVQALHKYFSGHLKDMCEDCRRRIDSNIWRILDCKQVQCREIIEKSPDIFSLFSAESQQYFKRVCSILDSYGVNYDVDPKMVRGLDYYVHTVFELTHPGLGAQNSILGGGRYEIFIPGSNKPLNGIGFAAGIERLLMARGPLPESEKNNQSQIFLVSLGERGRDFNVLLANQLRQEGIAVQLEVELKSMKSQMRTANRLNIQKVMICGDDEIDKNIVVFKDMLSGEQKELPTANIVNAIKEETASC